MIPIYIAFLWHMHQPIYWPGENVMQTQAAGHYGFDLLTIHLDRTGPYTAWPLDAVQAAMDAGLGSCGAQVSFTGSLMENLDAIEAAGAGFSGWHGRWTGAADWTTALGNPRIDLVTIGYYHPIFPLLQPDDIAMQIEMHRQAVAGAFPGTEASRGMFPPETGFSPEIIPALQASGVAWVIVDNVHFDRTLADYPYRPEGNLYPPNGADQRSEADPSWVSLSGIWAPTSVSAPWGYQPHRVRYLDPETGGVSEIITVPGARYEGNEDARGGFGALNYDAVLSQLAPYNTDAEHPMLVVLHHDGDNYGGGTDSYYHSNFDGFLAWLGANGDRFVCTTIQDYLDQFPPAPDDVIWVEPGSWSGADNGDPEFGKWNGDPGTDGYSPDRNSWAVITAAENRVHQAAALEPPSSVEDVRTGGGNASARAFHWLMVAETSCYWYWDRAEGGIWDSHPTRAANRAVGEADGVIAAHAGDDPTAPTIYPPQREPYNPGEFEWGDERLATDTEVWTFIYDVSGVDSAILRYRLDDDGVLTDANGVFATGGWCDIPMTPVPPDPVTDPLPLYQASLYTAAITGVEEAMVDYYVAAVDGAGNAAASPIRHVWVGSSGGTGPGGLLYYPLAPTLHDAITAVAGRAGALHWGINGWTTPPAVYWPPGTTDFGDGHAVETPLADADGDTLFEAVVGPFDNPSEVVDDLDFVFHHADGSWSTPDVIVSIDNAPGDAPHVFFVSPLDGEAVDGVWTVRVTATDDDGVGGVELLLDGGALGTFAGPPYAYDWDTAAAGTGPHTLEAVATDTGGVSGRAEVGVEVRGTHGGECVISSDAWEDAAEDAAETPDAQDADGDVPPEGSDLADGDVPVDGGSDTTTDVPHDAPAEGEGAEEDGGGGGCSCATAPL